MLDVGGVSIPNIDAENTSDYMESLDGKDEDDPLTACKRSVTLCRLGRRHV